METLEIILSELDTYAKQLGISRRRLANRLEIPYNTIKHWFQHGKGARKPSEANLIKITSFLKSRDEVYSQLGLERLTIFAIRAILNSGEECTFERLVKECFTLFPRSFSLYRYPQWPDSNKLDRPTRKLREKGWVVGSPKTGFSLTKFGERVAIEVEHELSETKVVKLVVARQPKGRERILMNYVKGSDTYKRFIKDKDAFTLTDAEFRNLLRCTLETPSRIVKQNFILCRKLAEESNETGIAEFLNACEQRKPSFGHHN